MRLIEMSIENFRQFYDKYSIKFASTNDKNVTVFIGRNGEGKTGIFRAINFCLYDMKTLEQDDNNIPLHLVNLKKLEENIQKSVTATVSVKLTHQGKIFSITRSVREIKTNTGEIESESETRVELKIFDAKNNMISQIVNNSYEVEKSLSFLSYKIRDFFFFDGEKIEKLAETNRATRKDIRNGIVKLLDIDVLSESLSTIKKIRNEQRKKMKILSADNEKLQNAYLKQEELYKTIEFLELERDKETEELLKNKDEQEKYEKSMKINDEIRELFRKKNMLNEKMLDKKDNFELRKQYLRIYLKNHSQSLIIDDFINVTKEFLDQELGKGSQNFIGLTSQLLENILQKRKCICGKTINENSSEFLLIQHLKELTEKNDLMNFLSKFHEELNLYFSEKVSVSEKIKQELEKIQFLKNEIIEIEQELFEITDTIKEVGLNQLAIRKNQQRLNILKIKEKELIKNIVRIDENCKQNKKMLEEMDRKIKIMEQDETRLKKETEKESYMQKIEAMLANIISKYSLQVRTQLSELSTIIFKRLIAKRDLDLINKIQISDNYEIEALDLHHNSILQDISKGQRHVVALSFITALVKIAAGGDGIIDMPLFMDSPFGRLDGENRENLIKEIPSLTSQWILLVTDRELISREFEILKKTEKLGKIFRVQKIEEYKSEIIEAENILITV